MPLPSSTEVSWVTATAAAVPEAQPTMRPLFSLYLPVVPPFPVLWYLSHAPLKKWIVTPLIFQTVALKGQRMERVGLYASVLPVTC